MSGHSEGGVQVQQRCRTVGVQNQAVERSHALEFVCGVQLATRFCKTGIHDVLYRLQLSAGAERPDALDLVGLDGEAFRQVHGVERNHLAFAGTDHQTRSTALTRRHQGQGVAILLDLHCQGSNALFLKQAEAADAARQIGLFVDCCGERWYGKRFVVKNGDIGHGYTPEMKKPAGAGSKKLFVVLSLTQNSNCIADPIGIEVQCCQGSRDVVRNVQRTSISDPVGKFFNGSANCVLIDQQ